MLLAVVRMITLGNTNNHSQRSATVSLATANHVEEITYHAYEL